jgi:hypothetical protein
VKTLLERLIFFCIFVKNQKIMAENYPVGIQHFSKLRENGAIYVDKTPIIYGLIRKKTNSVYFLSRPRRFGKSLLVSTLKEIFEGNKALFQGLYIYDKIDWEKYPVIQLSMSETGFQSLGLEEALKNYLNEHARRENLVFIEKDLGRMFRELIILLSEKYQKQVVILVDEYDKPIIHGLEADSSELAEINRDIMKAFYGGLKDVDNYIRFLFITGVSKFARVSIFSDLNHLTDISLHKEYATICGYTQTELEHYFPEGIQKLANDYDMTRERCLIKIKEWYDGFSWDGINFMYNPFSTLRLLESSQFSNYWFSTGTPTFLVKLLNNALEYKLENIKVRPNVFDSFDLQKLDYISILLQTGYLSIKGKSVTEGEIDYYLVSYSNKEVKESFNEMLLGGYLDYTPSATGVSIYEIRTAFQENDLDSVKMIIQTMFHSLPVELFEKKDRNGKIKPVGENFYHAIIYLIFNLLGVKMKAEVVVQNGRVDAVVETAEHLYLFEFKKDESPEKAIEQIKTNKYFGQYLLSNKIIHLIGVRFSLAEKGIDAEKDWKEEILGEE